MSKKTKNRFRLAIIFILFLLGALAGALYLGLLDKLFREPRVTVLEVEVVKISLKQLELNLTVEIKNQNWVGVKVVALEYELALAGTTLAAGKTGESFWIKGRRTNTVKVPVIIAYQDLKAIGTALGENVRVPYSLSGNVVIRLPGKNLKIPFHETDEIPVIRPAKFHDVTIKVKELTASGARLQAWLELENPNPFPLSLEKLEYVLTLKDRELLSGSVRDQVMPPQETGKIKIPMKVDFSAIGALANELISRRPVAYSFEVNATYLVDDQKIKQNDKLKGELKF